MREGEVRAAHPNKDIGRPPLAITPQRSHRSFLPMTVSSLQLPEVGSGRNTPATRSPQPDGRRRTNRLKMAEPSKPVRRKLASLLSSYGSVVRTLPKAVRSASGPGAKLPLRLGFRLEHLPSNRRDDGTQLEYERN
jgi:hypothetical protein